MSVEEKSKARILSEQRLVQDTRRCIHGFTTFEDADSARDDILQFNPTTVVKVRRYPLHAKPTDIVSFSVLVYVPKKTTNNIPVAGIVHSPLAYQLLKDEERAERVATNRRYNDRGKAILASKKEARAKRRAARDAARASRVATRLHGDGT